MQDNKEISECLTKVKDELQRTKADNRKLERELLETIQKKIKLSQQVEQWQVGASTTISIVKQLICCHKQTNQYTLAQSMKRTLIL